MMRDLKIVTEDIYKYDNEFDVMHVFLDNYRDSRAYYAEEEHKDLNVLRDEDTEEVAGFIIMEYSKHIDDLKKFYPQYFRKVPDLKAFEGED